MEGIEEKLNALMGNPQLMEQIMSLAQSIGGPADTPPEKPSPSPVPSMDISPAMLQKLMAFSSQTGLDNRQATLLRALKPYLTEMRLRKLEKAMRAAKLARLATGFLGSGLGTGLQGR